MNVSPNKKIMFLIATLYQGGAERVLSELSCNLPDNIEQVIVVYEKKITYPFKGKLLCLKSPPNSLSVFIRAYKFIQRIFRLKEIIKEEMPDCVVSFMGEANVLNVLVSKNPILTVHSSISQNHQSVSGLILRSLIPLFYNKAKVVVVSKGLKKDLTKRYRLRENQVRVIHNPVNIERVRQLSKERLNEEIFEDIPVVITLGRLCEVKGHWHLLRALSEVRKRLACKLMILGSGELEECLKKLVYQFQLENDVVFLGWQQNPFKFLARAKVFVLSSLWESFGNVLIEAMACGLPVISTDCLYGPREIIAPKSRYDYQTNDVEYAEFGVLTPVCDGKFYKADDPLTREETILADAIIKMMTDKEASEHYSKVGMQRARDFDVKIVVQKYMQLLTAVHSYK
jgi:glycosyltransferase involved in cell wall biosynthesis